MIHAVLMQYATLLLRCCGNLQRSTVLNVLGGRNLILESHILTVSNSSLYHRLALSWSTDEHVMNIIA